MSNAGSVRSVFEKLLDAFEAKAGLSPAELHDFKLTFLHDLKVQISIIQNEQRKSKKMIYLKRIAPFLDAMKQYGKAIEVFLNIHEVLAFIWVSEALFPLHMQR